MTLISCVSDEESNSPVITFNLLSETFNLSEHAWASEDYNIC